MILNYSNLRNCFLVVSILGCQQKDADRGKNVYIEGVIQNPEMDLLLKDLGTIHGVSHTEYSPSVMRLIDLGEASVDRCLEIFASDSNEERILQAETVIEMYTARRFGFKFGFGFPDGSEARWKQYLNSTGLLDHQDTLIQRRAVVKGWSNWRAGLPKDDASK